MVLGKMSSHNGHKEWPYLYTVTSYSSIPPLNQVVPFSSVSATPGWTSDMVSNYFTNTDTTLFAVTFSSTDFCQIIPFFD